MLERVFDTIRAILFSELPKDETGQYALIYDRPILHWYIGDRTILPDSMSVVIYGSSNSGNDVGFGLREFEHTIHIKCIAGGDDKDLAERITQEMTRVIQEVMLKHRRMWVCELCPICNKFILSPTHFTTAHPTILSPYVTAAQTAFNTTWALTHPVSQPAPALPASGLAADAYLRLWEAIRNDPNDPTLPADLTDTQIAVIQKWQGYGLRPIRLLYDFKLKTVDPSKGEQGQELFHEGEFDFVAKELIRIHQFGPDNVDTGAY